jgi:hypothetical protein
MGKNPNTIKINTKKLKGKGGDCMEELQSFMACMVSRLPLGWLCASPSLRPYVEPATTCEHAHLQIKAGSDIDERCADSRRALLECATAAVSPCTCVAAAWSSGMFAEVLLRARTARSALGDESTSGLSVSASFYFFFFTDAWRRGGKLAGTLQIPRPELTQNSGLCCIRNRQNYCNEVGGGMAGRQGKVELLWESRLTWT